MAYTGPLDASFFRDKTLGWSGQDFGAQGSTTWQQIADKLGTTTQALAQANKHWTGDGVNLTGRVGLSWLTQNMAGRLVAPGQTPAVTTQAQSDAFLANQNSTLDANATAQARAGQLTPPDPTSAGPWIMQNGQQVPNPAYTGPAVSPYDPNASMVKPALTIPATIPSSVLGSTATKGSVLQQAQSQQPTVVPTISSLLSTVKPGEQSANVASLQNALIGAGYSIPAIQNGTAKAGYYGDQTAQALKKYQADQALIANGGKQVDTSLTGIKKSLNDTLTALNTLKDKGITEIPDGADPVAYLNDYMAKTSGGNIPPIKTNFNPADIGMGSQGLISLFTSYVQMQNDRQSKMDELTKQMSQINSDAFNTKTELEYAPGMTKAGLGGEMRRLKEKVELQLATVQPQIDLITSQMNMDKEMFTSAVAIAQQINKMNEPEYHTVDGQLYQFNSNGKVTGVFGDKDIKTAGGGDGELTPYQKFTATQSLAKDNAARTANAREISRQLDIMKTAYTNFISGGDKNVAAQAIIATFNKILDPTSVVRESEYDRTAAGQSLLARIQGKYENLQQGGAGVTQETLKGAVDLASEYLRGSQSVILEQNRRAEEMAVQFGLNPSFVTAPTVSNSTGTPPPQTPASADLGAMLQSMNIQPQGQSTPPPTPTTGGFFSNLWSGITSSFK